MAQNELTICSRRLVTGEPGALAGPGAVRIAEGRIVEVRRGVHPGPGPTLDAGEHVVMPGVIDAHGHVNDPGRADWEGFPSAGRAAAAGGVTTMVVMPLNCSPVATTSDALRAEARAAAGACLVDYGFWGGVVPGNAPHLRGLWEDGVLGFKCFLVHSGIDEFPNVTERDLEAAMPLLRSLAPSGATLHVHAEDPATIDAARPGSGLDAAPRSYRAYLASRPPEAEVRAIERMITLCRRHRCRAHIVHVSAASALPPIRQARREGLPITAETCPHYLAFGAEEIGDGRTLHKCAPPIRDRANSEELWAALADGTLDLIASDHSPCPPELKRVDTGDFAGAWGGISSLQLSLPVVWTHAARRGHGVERLAQWLCAAPARLAGIDGMKGRLAPGLDADIVIWDPEATWTVRSADLHHRHKPTPYDGLTLRGSVKATFVRGRQVFGAPGFERVGTLGNDGLRAEAIGGWTKRTRA